MNEKAPDTLDANEKIQGRKAGFTGYRTLKAKGLIKGQMGPKRKSAKYEDVREMPDGGYGITKGNG